MDDNSTVRGIMKRSVKKLGKPVGNLLLSSGSTPPPPPNMKKCKQICRLDVRNGEKVKVAAFALLWTLNV